MKPPALRLKVLTFNVLHGYPLCSHIDTRLGLVERGIVAEAPDIILLQEISNSVLHGHVGDRLLAGLRAAGLDYSMVYERANGSLQDGGVFEEGSAILSRWPIREAERRCLAAAHAVRREYHGYEYEEVRIALRATLEIAPGLAIDVFGTHVTDAEPEGTTSPRRFQIEDLAAFVADRPSRGAPAIVGGDFNAAPESAEIAWFREQGFCDLCAENEPGPTNYSKDRNLEDPVDSADQRIDHLFVAPGRAQDERVHVHAVRRFLDRAFEVEPGRHLWASDHSGVLAEIELQLAQDLPPSSS